MTDKTYIPSAENIEPSVSPAPFRVLSISTEPSKRRESRLIALGAALCCKVWSTPLIAPTVGRKVVLSASSERSDITANCLLIAAVDEDDSSFHKYSASQSYLYRWRRQFSSTTFCCTKLSTSLL